MVLIEFTQLLNQKIFFCRPVEVQTLLVCWVVAASSRVGKDPSSQVCDMLGLREGETDKKPSKKPTITDDSWLSIFELYDAVIATHVQKKLYPKG